MGLAEAVPLCPRHTSLSKYIFPFGGASPTSCLLDLCPALGLSVVRDQIHSREQQRGFPTTDHIQTCALHRTQLAPGPRPGTTRSALRPLLALMPCTSGHHVATARSPWRSAPQGARCRTIHPGWGKGDHKGLLARAAAWIMHRITTAPAFSPKEPTHTYASESGLEQAAETGMRVLVDACLFLVMVS